MRGALDFLFEFIDDEVLDQELDKELEGGSKENNNYCVCNNSFLRINITKKITYGTKSAISEVKQICSA